MRLCSVQIGTDNTTEISVLPTGDPLSGGVTDANTCTHLLESLLPEVLCSIELSLGMPTSTDVYAVFTGLRPWFLNLY